MDETINRERPDIRYAVFETFNFGEPINSIDISNDGILLAAVDNHSLSIMNLIKNEVSRVSLTASINATSAKFNQNRENLLISVEKPNVNIALYNIEENVIGTVFPTESPVNNISAGLTQRIFAASTTNKMINIWDERSKETIMKNEMYGSGIVKLYPKCKCLLAVNDFGISLYDLRKFTFGPHTTYIHPGNYGVNSCIDVSSDESIFFATSVKNTIDVFSTNIATPVVEYTNYKDYKDGNLSAGFDKYSSKIFVGNQAGGLDIYDCVKKKLKYELPQAVGKGPVNNLVVNPTFMSVCTTLSNILLLWKSGEHFLPYNNADNKEGKAKVSEDYGKKKNGKVVPLKALIQ